MVFQKLGTNGLFVNGEVRVKVESVFVDHLNGLGCCFRVIGHRFSEQFKRRILKVGVVNGKNSSLASQLGFILANAAKYKNFGFIFSVSSFYVLKRNGAILTSLLKLGGHFQHNLIPPPAHV